MKDTKKDILLDVLGMTNQTYPTLALSKSGYGSKHPFTLSHKAPQSSLSVYADTPQFASAGIIFLLTTSWHYYPLRADTEA